MTPETMSALHNAAFVHERAWQADEFSDLLATPFVTAITCPHGFALTRTVAGESELLTLAVDPRHQRQGIARALLNRWLCNIDNAADTAFLEVAADNLAAIALYRELEFIEIAKRANYYVRKNSNSAHALIMQRRITSGNAPE